MLHKSSFMPKDARIMSYYEDDEGDKDDELYDLAPTHSGTATRKKKTTGTQALAEFLSTTSPEEFQRNTKKDTSSQRPPSAEPTSTSFFKLRKSKRALNRLGNNNLINPSKTILSSIQNSTQNSQLNYNRKNYVEITPKIVSSPSVMATTTTTTTTTTGPMLPQMGHHKKRDSSLYSGSLRYSTSIKSQLSNSHMTVTSTKANGRIVGRQLIRQDTMTTLDNAYVVPNHQMELTGDTKDHKQVKGTTDDQQQKGLTQELLSATVNMDVIEAGLIQRLERCKLSGFEKPSDRVTQTMGNEHVRALDVSFQQESIKTKSKSRHAQVQTMDLDEKSSKITTGSLPLSLSLSSNSSLSSPISGSQFPSPISDTSIEMMIEGLKDQLAEEKKHRQRLQASLDDTKDHFEVLAGLAYKKLREIWEEKQRWENTCMDLNQQLMMTQQQEHSINLLHPTTDDHEDINSVLDNVSVLS